MLRVDLCVEALSPQLTGIGRYTFELLRGLRNHTSIAGVQGWYQGQPIRNPDALLTEGGHRTPRASRGFAALRFHAGRVLQPGKRIFHGPNFMLPPHVESGIITVHDLSVFKYPEAHPPSRIAHFEREFGSSLKRARHIITDTEVGRQELIAFASLPPESVTTVHLGVGDNYAPQRRSGGTACYDSYGLNAGGYILVVATMEPRKRIETALTAYRALPDNLKDRYPLALAGATGWKNDSLHAMMADDERKGHVRFLGFIPEADLPVIYAGAALFLFPSIYEGFGLPPIEAMASGVPCIVSNRSCLPEVTQGAACLVDPEDIDSWSQAIEQALLDDAWQSEAREAGLQVASRYSWTNMVDKTAEIYRQVAETS